MTLHKAVAVAALVVGWLFLIPFSPEMPSAGLDPSWRYALNVAVAQGLVFGRDLVFTFGPLGSVYTHVYAPETDGLMMVGSALYGAAFCAMLGLAAAPRRLLLAMAVPVLIAPGVVRDPFFIAMPFLFLLNVVRVTLPEGSPLRLPPTRLVLALLALAAVALGMAPIIKGSFSGAIAPVAGIATLVMARRSIASACALAAAMAASLVAWWILCGQPLAGLPRFFIAQAPIISGYTGAMALNDRPVGPILFVVASAALSCALFFRFRREDRLAAWGLLLASAWTLFVGFKGGFVRHDGHAFMSAGVLLFLAYAAACVLRPRQALVAVVASAVVATVVVRSVLPVDRNFLPAHVEKAFADTRDGIASRVRNPASLQERYARAKETIRAGQPLPGITGTVDIYPLDLSAVLAHDLRWSGRPIFQSYSAYTPALLEQNAAHLAGPRAPDHVFFRMEPIDRRLPALDDSNSLVELLARYRIAGYADGYIHMARAPGAAGARFEEQEARSEVAGWGQTVRVDARRPAWVRIDLQRSLAGRAMEFLFKLPVVQIELTLADGSAVRHRYVPEIGRSGFLLSPYLASTSDVIDLVAGAGGREVRSFRLETRFPFLWQSTFGVRMVPVAIATQEGARAMILTPPSRTPPAPLLRDREAASVDCAIDAVNGAPYREGVMVDGAGRSMVRAQGWALPRAGSDARGFDTWIVASAPGGSRLYFQAPRQKRPDLVDAFRRDDAGDSGFNVVLDAAALGEHRRIEIFTASKDVAYRCPQSLRVAG